MVVQAAPMSSAYIDTYNAVWNATHDVNIAGAAAMAAIGQSGVDANAYFSAGEPGVDISQQAQIGGGGFTAIDVLNDLAQGFISPQEAKNLLTGLGITPEAADEYIAAQFGHFESGLRPATAPRGFVTKPKDVPRSGVSTGFGGKNLKPQLTPAQVLEQDVLGRRGGPESEFRAFFNQQFAGQPDMGDFYAQYLQPGAVAGRTLAPFLQPETAQSAASLGRSPTFSDLYGGGKFSQVPSFQDIQGALRQAGQTGGQFTPLQTAFQQDFLDPASNQEVFNLAVNPFLSGFAGDYAGTLGSYLQRAFDQFQGGGRDRPFLSALSGGTAPRAFGLLPGFASAFGR